MVREGAHPAEGFHDPTGTVLHVEKAFLWLSVIVTETVKAWAATKMCDTLPPEAVTPSPKSQLKDDAVVPFNGAPVRLTILPTRGLLGETVTVKGTGGGVLLSFHAVRGWISQPLNWCHVALRLPGSQ